MGLLHRFVNRMSSTFGEGCAKAMLGAFDAAKRSFPEAPTPALLIEAVSSRPSWLVEAGGGLTYKNVPTGHVIDQRTSPAELIYIVVSVELSHRLGRDGLEAIATALMQANGHLASLSHDREWTLSASADLPRRYVRWAGTFRVL